LVIDNAINYMACGAWAMGIGEFFVLKLSIYFDFPVSFILVIYLIWEEIIDLITTVVLAKPNELIRSCGR